MRHFNPLLTRILEDIDPPTTTVDQKLIAQTIQQFKDDKIDTAKAGRLLRQIATNNDPDKPLNVVADVIDRILLP